jgi:hypothetical protein
MDQVFILKVLSWNVGWDSDYPECFFLGGGGEALKSCPYKGHGESWSVFFAQGRFKKLRTQSEPQAIREEYRLHVTEHITN